jgi:hypothetical protein
VKHVFQRRHALAFILGIIALPTVSEAGGWRYRNNTAPSISGAPATTVMAGSTYSFTPVASDANGDRLRFFIKNLPAWAAFSSSTGKLSGTPSAGQAGTYSGISIYVSDGKATAFLPAFTLTVSGLATANQSPVISGTPATNVGAGSAYAFQPSATDANGDLLSFSISGKPAWAMFSISSGSLTGTPTVAQVGSYGNIVISVSDGVVSRSLPTFAINVTAPPATGTATLTWTAPSLNSDGSALTNLGGYRIYHGTDARSLSDVRTIANPGTTSYLFSSLASGTHFFAISAFNDGGAESALSSVGSKAIP